MTAAAPAHLAEAGRQLWQSVADEYDLDGAAVAILAAACEAADRVAEARAAIGNDGAYVDGRFGLKAHPALAVERDSRTAMLRALRELGLDAPDAGETRRTGSGSSFPRGKRS